MAKRIDMVYAGAVRHKDEVGHAYYVITDGAIAERAQVYADALGDFPVGTVCSYQVSGNGAAVQRDGIEFKGVYDDDQVVQEWQARHSSLEASELAWAARELPREFQCLDPIRDAYRQVDDEQRALLIAQVVRYIVVGT